MKKLMIALAAVAMAAGVQAASFTWATKTATYVKLPGGSGNLSSGTAYIFDAAKVSQAALVEAFATDKTFDLATFKVDGNGALDHQAVSAGKIAKGAAVTYGVAETDYSLFFALVNDGALYISDAQKYAAPAGESATQVQFSPTASSKLAAKDAKAGYSAAGWYTAVPEPTSGLLLLLGVAGLALRRRRA